jgi:hypothetical protein
MSHLLAISVGSVQPFSPGGIGIGKNAEKLKTERLKGSISASQRSSVSAFDLSGSHLLSEISRAAAREVQRQGGGLIFPASLDSENVANSILAELNGPDPRAVAAKAKNAAQACWLEFAKAAQSEAADVIEFYAAWVSRSNDYHGDRARVMRLLAGRKNCCEMLKTEELKTESRKDFSFSAFQFSASYVAVLVADGDRMGDVRSRLKSVHEHRSLSQALAGFAREAGRIVQAHCGVAIYAGGDDVLAFLPVDKCLECARSLHDKFADLPSEHGALTLSVGVAIGHFTENLDDLLAYGRAANKAAKEMEGKDALAVHLHKRGGTAVEIRDQWGSDVDRRLYDFAGLINRGIVPDTLPFQLRAMARLYERWPGNSAAAAIEMDLARLLARKGQRLKRWNAEMLKPILSAFQFSAFQPSSRKLLTLAKELLVARQIAAALKQGAETLAPDRETALWA